MHSPITSASIRIFLAGTLVSTSLPTIGGAETGEAIRVRTSISGDVSDLGDPGFSAQGGQVELTLDDAIALALERNLSILIQRYQHSQTLQGVRQALGIFDLNLSANLGFDEDSRATTSTLADTEGITLTNENLNGGLNLSQLLFTGGELGLNFSNNRRSSSDRNIQPNPSYFVNLGFTFSQPLLRGRGRALTEQGLVIARNQTAISRETFQDQVEDLLEQVSSSYWNLVEARNQLEVAEESLGLAQALHEMNVLREEAGVVAPLEVTRSEAELALQEEAIIDNRAQVDNRTDDLRALLNLDRGALWNLEIVPVTSPEVEAVDIDFEAALDMALANRPDVRSQRLEQDNREITARETRNAVKPQLDLDANWSVNALRGTFSESSNGGGSGGPEDPSEGDYFDALGALLDRDFEGWGVALRFSYPIQNRAAKAQKVEAELALGQGRLAQRQLEQQVMIEVRRAAREVETAAQQIKSAQRSRDLAQKTLEVEELSYRSGQSTGYDILESQERLREARRREASTITAYRRALASFYRSTGQLLEKSGVELAEDEASN